VILHGAKQTAADRNALKIKKINFSELGKCVQD
jgi:hypothetical protein